MPRQKYGKPDKNQPEIIEALEQAGCIVASLTSAGDGVPDLLVSKDGRNILIEVKDGKKKLNPKQVIWHSEWLGQVDVARTPEEAVAIVKRACKKE